MKVSNKLVKKLTNFAETYDGLKKAAKDVAEQIEDMKELVESGAELKIANFSRKTSVSIKNFAKSVEGLKDSVDEVEVAIDDASKLATKEAEANPELKAFARKVRVTNKAFSAIDAKFSEVGEAIASAMEAKATETNVKESVVPASAEINPNADETVTTTKVSANPPSPGVAPVEEGKINKAESVNFSKTEFVKFSLANALKAFAEFAAELEEAGDLVNEVVEVTTPESAPAETPKNDVEDMKKNLIAEGIEAYKAGDTSKGDEIANKAAELDAEVPGAGEEVVTAIENFAAQNPKTETPEEACPICGQTPCQCSGNEVEHKNFSASDLRSKYEVWFKDYFDVTKDPKDPKPPKPSFNDCIAGYKEECDGVEDLKLFKEVYESTPAPEAKNFSEGVDPQAELVKEQEALVEAGIKAFAAMDKDAADEVAKKAQELESKSEGAGEAVVETIENFAVLFKLGFGTKSISFSNENKDKVFCDIKDTINFAVDKMISGDKWDPDTIAAKCEDLEKELPGSGEIIVSTIENFNKLANNIKEKMTPDTVEKVMKDFSEAIEKFVEEIPVVDKTFAHKMKKACFEALESCDNGDKEACAKFCDTVSKGLSDPSITDTKITDFCKSLKDFCGRFSKFADNATQEAPAEVTKCDCELNEVLDKMGEKGAQLDAKTSTFATKLCDSYKSMKCFTEEQLENKIKLVESLKDSFNTVGVNFGEESVTTESEVKVESPAEQVNEPVVSVPDDKVVNNEPEAKPEVPAQLGPGEIDPALVNAKGDKDYDPTSISEVNLVEEEEVPESAQPSDGNVAIPVNFSKTDANYEDKLSTMFDL